ncbi:MULTISPECIES: acyl-CoA dehydrogenase family protein [Arsenicicoccus]|uniref:acyl-CoA dehydrogenase family protein n=1 Tax=Arsenicicoccus TaxID=267408 RepID=UPI00257B743A|nr:MULTISPECIES: acyl-CoA dehydrogenase family protein [Actinomycetes]
MRLIPTDDQDQLVRAAAEFLGEQLGTELVHRRNDAQVVSAELWRRTADLGLLGAGLPEPAGGLGLGLVEEYLVLREVGRIPSPGPFVSTILAAHVAAASGDMSLAQSLVTGETRAGLVLPGPARRGDMVTAASGDSAYALDARPEGLVIMLARERAALYDTQGLAALDPAPSLDPASTLARVSMFGAEPLTEVTSGASDIFARAMVLTAAVLTGVAEGALAASTQHAKVREQFGRPIGVNQAVKHRCADMALRAEAAAGQTAFAAAAFEGGRPDAELHAVSALLMAQTAARENAAANVQLHGGMGFTAEADAHLYVKRAEVLTHLLGPRAGLLGRLIELPSPR